MLYAIKDSRGLINHTTVYTTKEESIGEFMRQTRSAEAAVRALGETVGFAGSPRVLELANPDRSWEDFIRIGCSVVPVDVVELKPLPSSKGRKK